MPHGKYIWRCVIANITDELIPGCGKEAEIKFYSNTPKKQKRKKKKPLH